MGGWNIQTHHHTSLIPIQTHFIQTQCIASLPMNTFKNKYRIASARAPFWDYGWNAAYFVTICTQNRECWFGEISDGVMDLSPTGHIANSCWYGISDHFPLVELGVHIIMPNHVHGIVMINKPADGRNDGLTVETQNLASLPSPSSPSSSNCVRNGGMEHTDASPYVTDTNTDAFYTDAMHCVSTHEHI